MYSSVQKFLSGRFPTSARYPVPSSTQLLKFSRYPVPKILKFRRVPPGTHGYQGTVHADPWLQDFIKLLQLDNSDQKLEKHGMIDTI